MRRILVFSLVLTVLVGCGRSNSEPAPAAKTAGTAREPAPAAESKRKGEPAVESPKESADRKRADDAFERLVAAHRDEDPDAWTIADQELAALGASAVPTLVAALKSEKRDRRELASAVLARIGADAEKATDALVAVLDDDSLLVRVNAASVLALHSGPDEPERTEKLLAALKRLLADENVNIQRSAVVSLGNLGPRGAPAVPDITKLLDHADAELQALAATTLGKIGAAARDAVPALESLAGDEKREEPVRTAAADALESIRATTSRE